MEFILNKEETENYRQIYIDVILYQQDRENELIPNLMVELYEDNMLDLQEIVNKLKFQGFGLYNSVIQLKNNNNQLENFGKEPFTNKQMISLVDYLLSNIIYIFYQQNSSPESVYELSSNYQSEIISNHSLNSIQMKRVKERKIHEVFEKVAQWRNLYEGFYKNGQFFQMNLEQAAQFVNISKKTLDDYLLQIRLGKKYGFDFEKNFNQKVGVLRSFVKKQRGLDKNITNNDIKKRCNFKELDTDITKFLNNINFYQQQQNLQECF